MVCVAIIKCSYPLSVSSHSSTYTYCFTFFRAEQYASLENVLKPQQSSGPRAEFWKLRGLRGAKKILKKSREDLSAITNKAKYPPYEKVVLREGKKATVFLKCLPKKKMFS